MAFILGVIPARGGSKGIPGKNIISLCGKPLIAYTILAAQKSKRLSDCILSTDSREIADCASSFGLKTDRLRPVELATDTAKNIDTVIYEIKRYEKENKLKVDAVVLLQPTAPMRTDVDIDNSLDLFFKSEASSLISVYQANHVHPNIMYFESGGQLKPVLKEGAKLTRRQEFKPVYVRNGAIYIASREQVLNQGSFVNESPVPYFMSRELSINIDEPFDLELAEWMMSRETG